MKNISIILLITILLTGCSSTGYFADRGRDAADIFTFTVGVGTGVKARIGPLMVAIEQNSDLIGLRAGEFFVDGNGLILNDEFYLPIPINPVFPLKEKYADGRGNRKKQKKGNKSYLQVTPEDSITAEEVRTAQNKLKPKTEFEKEFSDWQKRPSKWSNMFGKEGFSHGISSISDKRNKDITARSPFPLIAKGAKAPFYSEIEVMAGFIFSIRAGANAGELLDFILGWTGIDIYGDDL
jgi:hypothetical protein